MPTCAADSCVDSCFVAFWMVPEKRARSATASSTVCLSRVSSENSAATKKPLPTIMRRASRSRNHSMSDDASPRGGEATDGRRGGQDGDAGFTPARTVTRHGGNPIPAKIGRASCRERVKSSVVDVTEQRDIENVKTSKSMLDDSK